MYESLIKNEKTLNHVEVLNNVLTRGYKQTTFFIKHSETRANFKKSLTRIYLELQGHRTSITLKVKFF